MERLLNFDEPLDIGLLDNVVSTLYQGKGLEQQAAQKLLTQFQEHPDAWTRVDYILEYATSSYTKFIGLQILEKLIQTRWKILPKDQQEGIRNYIVGVIIKMSTGDDNIMKREKVYIGKLNLILVQILKQEWPHNWPGFIPEIIGASLTNETLCENNMIILRLLSEEIFDFSAEQMVSQKAKNLKSQLSSEFSEIFRLCMLVLERATKPSLILATLNTLLRFLYWIPIGYIFNTSLIEALISKFLPVHAYRNVTLKCLTDVATLSIEETYDSALGLLFNRTLQTISAFLSVDLNIAEIYERSSEDDQNFVQNLSMFLCGFLKEHLKIVEKQQWEEASKYAETGMSPLHIAHLYLLKISEVDEREVFKVCLEYWNNLVSGLYRENPSKTNIEFFNVVNSINNDRKNFYSPILSRLRLVMIDKMAKPEEVLIVENDEGEIVREVMKDSDTIALYKNMRDCLVYMTHLDVEDTFTIMVEKLRRQVEGSEWSWNNLNRLCWAIGSISGAMDSEEEKRFLVSVIKDLLMLCEMKRGKDNKAVVASNIMYIVGQYPRFLRQHWKFLKTVINKLFEFMHETHEGVQDMACDTFYKISTKCHRHFIILQQGEEHPFINEILDNLGSIISDLQPSQIHVFYESVGCMLHEEFDRTRQEQLIARCMELPNNAWSGIISQASQNVDILKDLDTIKSLSNILKTNVAACKTIGQGFVGQLGRIYMDMLNLYRAISEIISNSVATQGNIATKTPLIRGMRTIKKETLHLVEAFVGVNKDHEMIASHFVPPLLDAILGDYKRNVPYARDAEVLTLVVALIDNHSPYLVDQIPVILEAIFESTLSMISQNFEEFPEHRVGFFNFVRSLVSHCFQAILILSKSQFKLIIDSIVWAFKHTLRDISDLGLTICLDLLQKMSQTDANVRNSFYQELFLPLLQDVFYVLTDTDHKSGFKLQAQILALMFDTVDSNLITAPLFDMSLLSSPSGMTNQTFLREKVTTLLVNAFPHLQRVTVEAFVQGLFRLNCELETFKSHLRDFLITIKEFSGQDNSDLYLEEKEKEMQEILQKQRLAAECVPGLLRPHERMDDQEDFVNTSNVGQ